jgi:hypothetical protein
VRFFNRSPGLTQVASLASRHVQNTVHAAFFCFFPANLQLAQQLQREFPESIRSDAFEPEQAL